MFIACFYSHIIKKDKIAHVMQHCAHALIQLEYFESSSSQIMCVTRVMRCPPFNPGVLASWSWCNCSHVLSCVDWCVWLQVSFCMLASGSGLMRNRGTLRACVCAVCSRVLSCVYWCVWLPRYFLSKSTTDLPISVLPLFVFVGISYGMVGLEDSAEAFFLTVLMMVSVVICAQSLGLFISATTPTVQVSFFFFFFFFCRAARSREHRAWLSFLYCWDFVAKNNHILSLTLLNNYNIGKL